MYVPVPMETSSWYPHLSDLNERPVFALRAFVELLLFPVTDVKDPAG